MPANGKSIYEEEAPDFEKVLLAFKAFEFLITNLGPE